MTAARTPSRRPASGAAQTPAGRLTYSGARWGSRRRHRLLPGQPAGHGAGRPTCEAARWPHPRIPLSTASGRLPSSDDMQQARARREGRGTPCALPGRHTDDGAALAPAGPYPPRGIRAANAGDTAPQHGDDVTAGRDPHPSSTDVAQQAEHLPCKQAVEGSSPSVRVASPVPATESSYRFKAGAARRGEIRQCKGGVDPVLGACIPPGEAWLSRRPASGFPPIPGRALRLLSSLADPPQGGAHGRLS